MDLITEFLQDLKIRGRTNRSVGSYKSVLLEFLEYYPHPENVNKRDLRDYLEHLQERDLHVATLKTYFSAISTFYDYLIYEEIATTNPVLPFRQRYLDKPTKHDNRQIPTLRDVRELLASIGQINHIAPIVFLAKTGARFGEYHRMTPEHIDFKRDMIMLPEAQKRHNRCIPMDLELKVVLESYIEWRGPLLRTPYLWVTGRSGHIHKDDTNAMIAHYAEKLGLHDHAGPLEKRLTCHCFRGFFTTELRRAGMRIEYLKILRGDSTKKQTWDEHYLSEEYKGFEHIRQEYLRCVPQLIIYDREGVSPKQHSKCLQYPVC